MTLRKFRGFKLLRDADVIYILLQNKIPFIKKRIIYEVIYHVGHFE